MTTVTKTIGTSSRDYSTMQAWEDALPSNLTTTRTNTCGSGSTTTAVVLDAAASAVDDFYNMHTLTISGEERLITDYVGATKTCTNVAFSSAPSSGTAYTVDAVACVGECYNDSEFTRATAGTFALVISGQTTDTTNTITLKCATGQSFRDHASVQTNALKYNSSNGVGLRKTDNYVGIVSAPSNNVKLIGLQFKHSGAGGNAEGVVGSGTNFLLEFCIVECSPASNYGGFGVVQVTQTGAVLRNSLIISLSANVSYGVNYVQSNNTLGIYNCTIVRASDKSASTSIGLRVRYNTSANGTIKNTAIFGFNAITTSGKDAVWGTASNNASDLTYGFGTSNQDALTYTSQFVTNGTVSTTMDWKPISTGSLDDNGVTEATHGPIDIAGTARPSGSAYDIGCWELVSAAASLVAKLFGTKQAVNRASTF